MKSKSLIVFALLLNAIIGMAHADSPAPELTYKKVSKNEKYVFVMLSLRNRNYDPEKIAEKYKESGLYLNDGSTTPLWRFGPYISPPDLSSDGQHMVVGGDWPTIGDKGETTAFTFYRNGQSIKSYQIKDLVPNPDAMEKSVSHYTWCKSWVFDEVKNSLTVETHEGKNSPSQKYQFDVTTGELADIADTATDAK